MRISKPIIQNSLSAPRHSPRLTITINIRPTRQPYMPLPTRLLAIRSMLRNTLNQNTTSDDNKVRHDHSNSRENLVRRRHISIHNRILRINRTRSTKFFQGSRVNTLHTRNLNRKRSHMHVFLTNLLQDSRIVNRLPTLRIVLATHRNPHRGSKNSLFTYTARRRF